MSLFEDYEQERLVNAKNALYQSHFSAMSPEQARANYAAAARYGVTPQMLSGMSHDQRARLESERALDWDVLKKDDSRSAFLQSLGDPEFATLVRDDVNSMGIIERAAWWLAGDPEDPTGRIGKTMRNSAARGALGGFNSLPYFGNTEKAIGFRAKRDELTSFKARLDSGEDPRKVFNMGEGYTDAEVKENVKGFRDNYEKNMAAVEENLDYLADRISHFARASALYPQGAEMQGFNEAKGWDAAREMFLKGNFWMNVFNMAPESFVQGLPTIGAVLASSAVTGGATGAMWAVRATQSVVQGLMSFGQDKQASLLGYMTDHGVNIYDAKAVSDYLKSGDTFSQDLSKATAHATGTGAFDALGMAAGGIRVVKPLALKGPMPEGASFMQTVAGNVYARTTLNVVAGGQIQGLLGAAGEASGQLLAEGKITSVNDIIAEYAGEHFTAPLEMISAGIGAKKAASLQLERAMKIQKTVEAISKAAQESKVAQEAPQVMEKFVENVTKVNPTVAEWTIDTTAFNQDEIQSLAEAVGEKDADLAKRILSAAQGGEPLRISASEMIPKILANKAAADLVIKKAAAAPVADIYATTAELTLRELDKRVAAGVEAETKDPTFRQSLANVGKQLDAMFETGGVTGAVRDSNKTILMTHVANMANETGMSPEQVWDFIGLKGIESQAKEKAPKPTTHGAYTPALRKITLWNADKSTVLHEGAHWFLDGRVKLAAKLIADAGGALSADQKRFVDVTRQAVEWASGKTFEEFSKMSAEAQRDAQEKFARTYEQYLRTGFAPTSALQRVFSRFSQWLKTIYGALVQGSALTPESKKIFDDLFTAGEAVKEAELRNQLLLDAGRFVLDKHGNLLTADGGMANLSAETSRLEVDDEGNLTDAAVEKLLRLREKMGDRFALLSNAMLKKLTTKARNIRARLRAEAKEELSSRREQRVYDKFHAKESTRRTVRVTPRLSVDELQKAGIPQGQIGRLMELGVAESKPSGRNRMDIPKLLKKYGYKSVQELVDALNSPNKGEREAKLLDAVQNGYETEADVMASRKLSATELKRLGIPEERIKKLIELRIAAKRPGENEISYAEAVGEFGYSSPDEFAQAFDNFKPMDSEMINKRTQELMDERYPELSTPESIDATADAAVFTPLAATAVAREVEILDKNAGVKSKPLVAQFMLMAEGALAGMKKRDVSPRSMRQWASNMSKRAQAEREKPGDPSLGERRESRVVEFKRLELFYIQSALCAESFLEKLAGNMKEWRKRYQGKDKSDRIQIEYFEQIQSLLAKVGVIEKTAYTKLLAEGSDEQRARVAETRSFAAFREEAAKHGWTIPKVPEFLEAILSAEPTVDEKGQYNPVVKSIDDLTVREINDLTDFVEGLEAMGTRARKIVLDGREVDAEKMSEDLAKDIKEGIEKFGKKPIRDMEATRGDEFFAPIKHLLRAFGAAHIKIPAFLCGISGRRDGAAYKVITKLVDQPVGRKAKMLNQYSERLLRAFKPLMKSLSDHKLRYYKGLGTSLTKTQLIVSVLNMGNEENTARLLEGSIYYPENQDQVLWTRENLKAAIAETFTTEELLAVQRVWDLFDPLRNMAFDVERRVGNRIAEEVPLPKGGVEFKTKDGSVVLRGGYYPIAYDMYLNGRSSQMNIEEHAANILAAVRGQSTVDTSRTKSRTGRTNQAVALTFRAGADGLTAVIHDICMREAIQDLNKLFDAHGEVAKLIRHHWGIENERAIRKWIDDMATDGRRDYSMGDELSRFMRQGLSVAMIGLNPLTAISQVFGLTQSSALIGGKWVLAGYHTLLAALGNKEKTKLKMMARSAVLRDRAKTQFRELAEAQRKLNGSKILDAKDWVTQKSYWMLANIQLLMVDFPTWQGAYEKAISEGMSEKDAVLRADRDLLDAQGSSRISDLSGMERGTEAQKLWTVMYSFFNTTLNLAMMERFTDDSKMRKIWRLFLILCLQSALDTGMRSFFAGLAGDKDAWDEEKLFKKLAAENVKFSLGMFVWVREFSAGVDYLFGQKGNSYSGPTGAKLPGDVVKLMQQIGQGEMDTALAKAGVSVMGDLFGLPSTQMNRVIDAASNDGNVLNYLFGIKDK